MTGNVIVSVIAIIMALVLAVRGLRHRTRSPKRLLLMAGAWIVIVILVTLIINSLGLAP